MDGSEEIGKKNWTLTARKLYKLRTKNDNPPDDALVRVESSVLFGLSEHGRLRELKSG